MTNETQGAHRSIFRKESIDRISSPDQLDEYIRVQNPGVWAVLITLVALLGAGLIWACTAKLETTVSAFGIMDNGHPNDTVYCYLRKDAGGIAAIGQMAKLSYVAEYTGTVTAISGPFTYQNIAQDLLGGNTYAIYMADIREGNEYYQVTITGKNLPNAAFDVTIIADSVTPISFLLNRDEGNETTGAH